MKVLWITNRPIAAAERKFNVKAISGTWMEPTLLGLEKTDGIEISVATVAPVNAVEHFEEDNITYYLVPQDSKRTYRYDDPAHIKQWEQVIDEAKPDIIMQWGTEYAHGLCVLNIAKKRGIPSVTEMQGIMETIEYYYLSNLTKAQIKKAYSIRNIIKRDGLYEEQKFFGKKAEIEKKMLALSENIIIENEWAMAHCRFINPESHLFVHHQSIGEMFFNKNWSLESCERHSIFTCASAYPLKGLHVLIEAIAIVKRSVPDVKLYVPGMRDPFSKTDFKSKFKRQGYEKYLMYLINSLDLRDNVVFTGRLTQQQMADRMEKSHIMVIPSSIENLSTTLREAMAVGVPSIASYVGGIPETVKHGENGYLFRHEEYIQLADFILRLFNDDEKAKLFSQNGKNYIRPYLDINKSTEQLVEIYKEIIKK